MAKNLENHKNPEDHIETDSALLVESANYESRRVQYNNEGTLVIKPTLTSLAFSLLFVILGLSLIGFYLVNTLTTFEGPGSAPLMLVGILFAAAGLVSYHSNNRQLIINRDVGVAFMQSWNPSVSLDTTLVKTHVKQQDIVSIQTISRLVKHRSNRNTRRATYTQYQVNLRTSDSKRHNLFVTLKAEKAEILANDLTRMFKVPLVQCISGNDSR